VLVLQKVHRTSTFALKLTELTVIREMIVCDASGDDAFLLKSAELSASIVSLQYINNYWTVIQRSHLTNVSIFSKLSPNSLDDNESSARQVANVHPPSLLSARLRNK